MIAPNSESVVIVLRCPVWRGASRTSSVNRRRSLRTTSAARDKSEDVTPVAISDIVLTEHGAMIMPCVRNDPDEMGAATSSNLYQRSARLRTSDTFTGPSCAMAISAARETTRWVSTGVCRNSLRRRTPYAMPDAPVIPTISRTWPDMKSPSLLQMLWLRYPVNGFGAEY